MNEIKSSVEGIVQGEGANTIHVDTRGAKISLGMPFMAEVKTGKREVVGFFLPAYNM